MTVNLKFFRIALVGLFAMFAVALQAQTVTGNVKDSNGDGIIGATIMEHGTKNGTVTDIDGNFTIKMTTGHQLDISYIGMKSQTVDVKGKSSVNVVLADDNTTLNEVVVVGYGTMKKSDLTGSVSSVNTEQLNAKGAASVLGNLQGSTPGVNITMAGGRTGGTPSIEIRGKSSINSDVSPLYVVDGVMCDDIDWLNPQDIEKIDILKDASSTAIYGSRATAGVVMVTTKGGTNVGKDKKATISYDGYVGWTQVARMPEFMDAQEFYDYRFLKFLGYANSDLAGASPAYSINSLANLEQCLISTDAGSGNYVLKNRLKSGVNVNWPEQVTQNGIQQNHYLAVSGGSTAVSYHVGLGYNGEDGVYAGDSSQKYNFKGSLDGKITDWLNAGFNINFGEQNNKYATDSAIKEAYRMNPFIEPYDEDGNIIHTPGLTTALGTKTNQFTSSINPLDLMKGSTKKRETWRLLGNVYLEIKPFKGFSFKTTFSPNYTNYREGYFEGHLNSDGQRYDDSSDPNYAYYATNRGFSWTWDNIVNYNTTIAKDHSLGIMGLFSQQQSTTEFNRSTAYGVDDGTLWYNLPSGTYANYQSDGSKTYQKNGSRNYYNENSMTSYAARLNYSYKSRYLLTATVRWDGSSKFAKGNRWGCFPSAALAWRITEEDFMKNINWISNLKLRLSYGVTGNCDGIGNFASSTSTKTGSAYYYGGESVTGKLLSAVIDPNLKWEKSNEWNLGLDFGFLNSRINGSIDVYQKTSSDLLYDVTTPLAGYSVTTNIGKVRNRGIEIALNGDIIKSGDWKWSAGITFAANKNEVKQINGESDRVISSGITTGSLFVNYSVNSIYGFVMDGIVSDKTMNLDAAQQALYTAKTGNSAPSSMKEYDYYYGVYGVREGQPKMHDSNMDGTIDDSDRQIICSDPKFTAGFNTSVSWKNIDFSMNLYSKVGGKAYSALLAQYFDWSDRGRSRINVDYYIPAGTLVDCDGMNADGTLINPVYQSSTHYGEYAFPNNGGSGSGVGPYADQYLNAVSIENCSFVKVKNITLGYTFPKSLLQSWKCQHLRLYFTVTNPFCFTKFKGFDPEWASSSLQNDGPSTITYQIGASIKF